MYAWRARLALAGAVLFVVGTSLTGAAAPTGAIPPLSTAPVVKADFPPTRQIATIMAGQGTWRRSFSSANYVPLGHNPEGCSSEQAFPRAELWRDGQYTGRLRAHPKLLGWVTISIFHFADPVAAATDFAHLGTWVSSCPQSREWYCEDCDGLTDYTRTRPAALNFAGGAVTWKENHFTLLPAGGRAIAQLTGSSVIVVWAGHSPNDVSNKTPKAPSLTRVKNLARAAVAVALD